MYVVITLVIIGLLAIIFNAIFNKKDKIAEKLKLEKKEIKKCPQCYKEYVDLKKKKCANCGTKLEKTIKYKLPKELKIKIQRFFIIICIIIGIGVCIYLGIKEKQRTDIYNNDINACYNAIKEDANWDKFKEIINKHTTESNFETKAFDKFFQAIDEGIENLKNGNEEKELISMIIDLELRDSSKELPENLVEKFKDKYTIARGYDNILSANKHIEKQEFKDAFDLLQIVIINNKDKNQDIFEIATNKQNEIKDKAMEQIIAQAQEKINAQDYSATKTLLEKYKDLGNQTISDMYNNATSEINRIESEKRAKEEAERRAREQEALSVKKDKLTIDSNGKKIWKVCMSSNTFRFQANFVGSGNFIVKLLDDNQELEELICNEIGSYNVDKTVKVQKDKYYYIETYVSEGNWTGNWWGTYGD